MTAVKATSRLDERGQELQKPGAIPLKMHSTAHDRTYDCTIQYALTAMQQIHALRAPADPESFQAAIGTGADFAQHLSGASKRLDDTKDQESFREIIGMLSGMRQRSQKACARQSSSARS